jgi:hypothetical protein
MTGKYEHRSGCTSHPLTEPGGRAHEPERHNANQAETMPHRPASYAQATSRSWGQYEPHFVRRGAQIYPDPGGAPADRPRASSSSARTAEPSRVFHNQPFSITQGFEDNAAPMDSVEVPTNIEFCPGCLKTTAPPGFWGQTWDKYQQWYGNPTSCTALHLYLFSVGACPVHISTLVVLVPIHGIPSPNANIISIDMFCKVIKGR